MSFPVVYLLICIINVNLNKLLQREMSREQSSFAIHHHAQSLNITTGLVCCSSGWEWTQKGSSGNPIFGLTGSLPFLTEAFLGLAMCHRKF